MYAVHIPIEIYAQKMPNVQVVTSTIEMSLYIVAYFHVYSFMSLHP